MCVIVVVVAQKNFYRHRPRVRGNDNLLPLVVWGISAQACADMPQSCVDMPQSCVDMSQSCADMPQCSNFIYITWHREVSVIKISILFGSPVFTFS